MSSSFSPVVRVITSEIRPEKVEEFNEWEKEGKLLMKNMGIHAKLENFQSQHQNNSDDANNKNLTNNRIYRTVVLTFPSIVECDRWMESEERRNWFEKESGKYRFLVSSTHVEFEEDLLFNWMKRGTHASLSTSSSEQIKHEHQDAADIDDGPPPPRWRMAIVIASAVFPTVLLMQGYVVPEILVPLVPWLGSQPLAVKVCANMSLMTPTMTYVSLPIMMKLLGPFALKKPRTWKRSILNWSVIGFTYGSMIEIGLLATGETTYVQNLLLNLF